MADKSNSLVRRRGRLPGNAAMTMSALQWRRMGIGIVLLHGLVVVIHSLAHSALIIYLATWQNIYVFAVIIVLPVVAAVLLWRRASRGFLLLLFSMLGALLFGGYYHFILPGPDNVSHLAVHTWALPFQVSAVLLALVEAVGVVVGLMGLSSHRSTTADEI